MAKTPSTPKNQPIITDVTFKGALEERYLSYALSTIMARSLPDVRDGLKPVHRRLLFAMLQLKLDPKSGFKKCARVVGDVIGKYHPHGDVAVYDALVRLAQGFAVRYPLVDGQGNFGSVDGDNAAAMRYTEARLTEIALMLMEGLGADTVDFRATYDGEDSEPVVFPSSYPNLLANGTEGIAVGMATSIPPHNLGELCEALLWLIKSPNATTAKLVSFVQGPDFPTGGTIVEPQENIVSAYDTGRGAFRIRAKWAKEPLSHGLYQIVVTEIPYQVAKSKLIERIAELFREKKLPLLGNIRDESAEEIRIVLEPRSRTVDPAMLMESLFRATDLETRFNLNLNVLTANGVPQVMSLREALTAFLAHRQEVVVRRSTFRLGQIAHRLEVLDGFLIAYLNLDEVIRIIREEEDPKAKMMKKWKLTDVQVEAILNMRLRSLRKLEEFEIKREHKELRLEQADLKETVKSEEKRWNVIADELRDIKKRFGQATKLGKRRTAFGDAPVATAAISIEAFVEKEPITVLVSKMGWVRALKGHEVDLSDVKYKEGDEARFELHAQTTDKLVLLGTNGRFYTLAGDKLPRGKAQMEPIRLMVELGNDDDVVEAFVYQPGKKLLVASSVGKGFIVPMDDVVAQTRSGKQILNVPVGARAVAACIADGDLVAVVGSNRKLLVFPIVQIPEMKRGAGVALQKYKDAELADVKVFSAKEGLSWKQGGAGDRVRTETNIREWLGTRASVGKLPPQGFPRSNRFG